MNPEVISFIIHVIFSIFLLGVALLIYHLFSIYDRICNLEAENRKLRYEITDLKKNYTKKLHKRK